ncbi:MAG: PD-(D/E)XK nuclease family protein, partial [Endomicrobia bacterium]|nr:PD-(D/E)XK nuclease family protein [Endomicrobiia bacterium]
TFETFYAFIPWGYEIYNFIEQLNFEDIPVENLLKINHFITAESGIPSSITKLVKSIIEINNKFYLQLEEKKLYTRSKVFKLASIYARDIQLNEFKKIIFVTPFYLHKTELDLIKLLQNNNKIVIFFQTDTSFNTKNGNSCWQAFQRIEKYLGVEIKLQNQKEELTPRIYFYSAFDKETEINFVHQVLKELDRNEIEKTVVVLPDDEISTVLLHALPETVEEFNLVCGYPLKRSTIYCFLKTIFISQINKKNESYYTKYYIDTITHPLVRNLNCNLSSEIVSLIVQTIESVISGKIEDATLSKSIFVNLKDIESNSTIYKSITNALLSKNNVVPISKIKKSIRLLHWMLFEQWEKVETFSEFCNAVKILLDAIFNQNVVDKNLFNLKVIEKLYDMINIFNSAMFVNEKFTVEEMFKVFLSEIERVKISLIGSPVRGLQILGFYETRNLNFENVIIVDVNEGVLPFLKTKSILIPREILLQLGIDRIEIEEEIQRYHFKRLIASAKNVHLIYVETDQHERSRYVEELIWEQQKKKKELKIENIISGFFQVNFKVKKRDIKKTKDIIEYLKTMIYSTSALDIYLQCPLKFYFNYVLSLEEEEVYVDEPESKDIGNFIHSLLEQTFSPY